jgi:hypothetical protein
MDVYCGINHVMTSLNDSHAVKLTTNRICITVFGHLTTSLDDLHSLRLRLRAQL